MAIVTGSVEVAAPLSAVYNQWTQFTSFPHFMSGLDTGHHRRLSREHEVRTK